MKFKLLRSIVATTATLTTIPLATIGLASCGNNSSTSITLDKTSLSLSAGEISTITATVNPSTATVTWSSSNTSIATVSDGTVTAVAAGTATITATANGQSATCTVTVTAAHIVVPESEKSKDVGVNDYAIYTVTVKETISSVSDLTVSATTTDTSYGVSATIDSFKSNTLKVKVTATAKSNTNSTSVVFNLTVAKSDGSWTQTVSNLTMTGLAETKSTYKIFYSTIPTGLTITTKPTSTLELTTVTVKYELDNNYYIDGANCVVKAGTTTITSKCSIGSELLVIPSTYVTGNITITLAVKSGTNTYAISHNTDANITWTAFPNSVSNATGLTAGSAKYTIANGYKLNTSSCKITSGGSNITPYATFTDGSVIIPASSIIGDVVITLVSISDSDTGTVSTTVGSYEYMTLADFKTAYPALFPEDDDPVFEGISKVLYLKPENSVFTGTISKVFSDTVIYMDTKKSKYNITLDNLTISNSASNNTFAPPVFLAKCKNSSTVNLTLSGTNKMLDKRTITTEDYYSDDAVFKSQAATNILGSGSLAINDLSSNKGIYGKGIQTSKGSTLTISNGTVNVFSYGTALQSDGKLNITGGTVTADSYYDDGIKTKFADPEDDLKAAVDEDTLNIAKDITISGGNITVYSARNGINAAHDVITSGSPTINIYTTSTNASGKVGSTTLDELNMYVKIPSSCISYSDLESNYFTVTFNDGTVEYLTLKKIKTGGGGGPGQGSSETNYYFKCDRPLSSSCTPFVIKKYAKDQFGAASPTATATSGSVKISSPTSTTNTSDTVSISSISGSTITAGSSLSANYKESIGQGASVDTTVGSKGIKAKNEVELDGGTINIKSNDTGITAGYGNIYCNSPTAGDVTYSTGNITIDGATVTVASNSGDGVKAYGVAETKSGTLNVTNAVEALEAGKIVISGGVTKLVASDDGVNASEVGIWNTSSSVTSNNKVTILVSGGVLDVQTNKTSDTDAIDSNNDLKITGGLIVARVPGSNPSAAIDTESKTLTATGGTIVVCGAIEPSISSLSYNGSGSWYSGKSYTVSYDGTTYKFTNSTSMNSSCKWYSNDSTVKIS